MTSVPRCALCHTWDDQGMWNGRYEFMLVIAPLQVVDGISSPANPIALF